MMRFAKYSVAAACFYAAEFVAFAYISGAFTPVIVNLLVRSFFVICSALVLRKLVFDEVENFYPVYLVLCGHDHWGGMVATSGLAGQLAPPT